MPAMHRESRIRDLFRAQGPLLALIGAIFAIFFLQVFPGGWEEPFELVPADIAAAWRALKEGGDASWWTFGTLLTCELLHGGPEHVLFNMLYLWIFGAIVAELLGHRWVFLIFVLTAVSASIMHVLLNPGETIPCIGASGAVMGFEGAYLGLAVRWRLPDPHVWPIAHPVSPARLALLAVVGVFLDLGGIIGLQGETNIAYGAHIGGFVGGLLLATLAAPKPRVAKAR